MIIILFLALVAILFFMIHVIMKYIKTIWAYDDGWLSMFFGALAFLGLALALIPLNISCERANIERFHSLEQTVIDARANTNISEFELAALQQTIAEMNKDLASKQFWTKHPLTNWYLPKELLELRPIK